MSQLNGLSNGSAAAPTAAHNWIVPNRVRQASHAGSWYSADDKELGRQLGEWLDKAGPPQGIARALISP